LNAGTFFVITVDDLLFCLVESYFKGGGSIVGSGWGTF